MPPPRLPRHLRPCPPSVTARQVRCIHATGSARLWTSGRDAPQTPSAKSDNGDKSDSIDRPDTRRDAPGKKGPWWKQALGRISSIGAHDHESASLEPKSETSHYDKQLEHSASHVQGMSEAGDKGEQGIGTKSGPPSYAQQPTVLSRNGQNVETPGDTAEARSTATQSPAVLATETRDSDTLSKTQKLDLKPEPNRQRMNASRAKHLKRREVRRLMSLAETYYLHSVGFLGNTATLLSKMDSPAVTPAVSSILRRFRSIYRISMLDDDVEVSWQCQKFKPTLDLLASKSHQPRAADRDLIDSLALKSIRTDIDVVNYSKTLLHGDVITRTVKACQSRYRGSTEKLLEIADVLQAFESPMVAPIASRVRQRLDAIAEQASREDDMLTLQSFTYYKKTRSVRKPWLSESVATLKRKAKNVEKRWTSYERQARNLRKELSAILPKVPEPSYGPTSKALRRVEEEVARKKADLRPSKHMEDAVDVHSSGVPDRIESNDGHRLMNQIHSQSRSMTSSRDLTMDAKGPGREMARAERHSQSKNAASSNLILKPSASTSASTATPKTDLPKQGASIAMSEVSASISSHTTSLSEQPAGSDELSEQSLLEELFPEVSSTQHQTAEKNKKQYPKLALPKSTSNVRPKSAERPPTFKQKVVESLQQQGEQITVLQLTNCSTELTEVDFRRIIPKGKHLEGWRRDSDFYKVIPGRDPLSLERLPFYYLLFKNTEAAISYQKNASRLHKLCALHQPSNILSAIPPPKGFLEDGEDIAAAVTTYNLLPRNHPMSLNILMQPYNPALRLLIQRGGYQPIAPSVDDKGKRIWRVLLHIEGWEPSPSDLFAAIVYDAFTQGILNPLRNESQSSLHRLRDVINLRTGTKLVSSSRPRAYGSFDHSGFWQATGGTTTVYDDPEIQNMMGPAEDEMSQGHMNQYVMNRVYNRWVLDFEDADSARRWSLRWHRRVFPDPGSAEATWRDHEEPRICNAEVLW